MLPDLNLEDRLRLRKPHPCGSYEWKVVRLGADIGIECLGCGRRVLLPRRQLARRIKSVLTSSARSTGEPASDLASGDRGVKPSLPTRAAIPDPALRDDEIEPS